MQTLYVRNRSGEVQGPLSLEDVNELTSTGHLGPHDRVSRDGEDWQPANRFDGLHFAGGSVEPVHAPGALTLCRDCQATISRRAPTCPRCGAPRSPRERGEPESSQPFTVTILFIVALLLSLNAVVTGSIVAGMFAGMATLVAIGFGLLAKAK